MIRERDDDQGVASCDLAIMIQCNHNNNHTNK